MHWKRKLAKEIEALEKLDQTSSVRSKLTRLRRRQIQNPGGNNQQRSKKACPHGHRYTKANTYITKKGARACRICRRRTIVAIRAKAKKTVKKG